MSTDPRIANQRDLFRTGTPPSEPSPKAPFQVSSTTSYEAAKRVSESPAFHGNRLVCLREIAHMQDKGGATRKSIAEKHFGAKQNYTTGPVAVLIEEGYVYEEPALDRSGFVMRRDDHSIIPRKIEGSAVLRLTSKGRAATAGAA